MERPVEEGPIGVWVEYPDGERFDDIPVIYDGRDEDGYDLFDLLLPRDIDEDQPRRWGAKRFPAKTAVNIPLPTGFNPRSTEEPGP